MRFDLNSTKIDDQGFYASVSIDSNLQAKRRIQEDTLLWWLKQDAAALEVFHEPKQTLEVALCEFADWLGNDECHMWSNGADFDLPMLAHAFTSMSMEVPWKFWNTNCFRTYKKLPGAKLIRATPTGVKHNALADAYSQAQTLQMIQHKLFGEGAGKHSMIKAKT